MSTRITYGLRTFKLLTDREIQAAWDDNRGQGNKEARERGNLCVVWKCDRAQAVALSRLFHWHFAVPESCHYDGETLSAYCGGAGGNTNQLKTTMEGYKLC